MSKKNRLLNVIGRMSTTLDGLSELINEPDDDLSIGHPVCVTCKRLKKCPVKRNVKKFYCADHSELVNG